MFSLTLREQFLVAGVLCALVTGAAVRHWREARRNPVSVVVASGDASAARSSSVP